MCVCVCVCVRAFTSYSKGVLVLLVTGEEDVWAKVFTGELLPGRGEVLLLDCGLHLHLHHDAEQLWVLFRSIARIQLWSAWKSERKRERCEWMWAQREREREI